MKLALWLAMVALLQCSSARAHDVQTGSMMICDTQRQAERFAAFFSLSGNAQFAINAVNTEAADPDACAFTDVAFVRGLKVGMIRTRTDAFEVVEILVVGVRTPSGFQPANPGLFFTLVKVPEYAV